MSNQPPPPLPFKCTPNSSVPAARRLWTRQPLQMWSGKSRMKIGDGGRGEEAALAPVALPPGEQRSSPGLF